MTVTISWSVPGMIVSTTALPPEVTLYFTTISSGSLGLLPFPTHSPASCLKWSNAAFVPESFPCGCLSWPTSGTDARARITHGIAARTNMLHSFGKWMNRKATCFGRWFLLSLDRVAGQAANFDLAADEQTRAALGELGRGVDVRGLDDRKAADDFFGFDERAVGDDLGGDHLAFGRQRVAGLDHPAGLHRFADPLAPFFQVLL